MIKKLLRNLRNHKDCRNLHNYINKINEWSKTWEIEFNEKKITCIENEKDCNETLVNT